MKNGLILAEDELKKTQKFRIKLLIEDGQGDPKISISVFKKLSLQNVKFFISGVSSVCLALLPEAKKNETLLFADVAHPQITAEKNSLIFRHSNTAEQESEVIASFLNKDKNIKKLFILWINDDFGLAMKNELIAKISKSIFVREESFEKNQTDFRNIVDKVLNLKPEGVIVVGYGKPLGIAIKTLKERNFKGLILVNAGLVITPDAISIAKDALEGIYYNDFNFNTDDEKYKDFVKKYREKFNKEPAVFSIMEYNTLLLLGEAIKKVGDEPQKVAEYIRMLKSYNGVGEYMTIKENGDILPSIVLKRWEGK